MFSLVSRPLVSRLRGYFPGVWLACILTAAAYQLHGFSWLSSISTMILGILMGVVLNTLAPLPAPLQPGLKFTNKTLLRFSVALLGVQITFGDLFSHGVTDLFSAALVLFCTFALTLSLGKAMGISRDLTTLIAAGTSICGASAIAGANGALGAKEQDVSYAMAAITLFGTLALFFYPVLGAWMGLEGETYGQWIGLSVHEVSQVVGAGFQGGEDAGRAAVIAKLCRVILLTGVVFWLVQRSRKTQEGARAKTPLIPGFVLGFLALAGANSLGLIPQSLREILITLTPVLLTTALCALGLGTNLRALKSLGLKPLALCAIATAFIAILSRIVVAF